MKYEDLMPRLRTVIPKKYLKFRSVDKTLVFNLVKPDCESSRKLIENTKDETFNVYASRTNRRSISSLAKKIIDDCSPTAFSDFLDGIDDENHEIGDIADKIAASFQDRIPGINALSANEDIARLFYNVIKEASEKQITRKRRKESEEKSLEDESENNECSSKDVQVESSHVIDPLLFELTERIEEHEKLYVQTKAYENAIKIVSTKRLLLLVGAPGSGKSFTSEMIVKHYIELGFIITVANQVDDLRGVSERVISTPEKKELVYIDDCLGQAYMSLNSEQENDLVRLVYTVKQLKTKYLLLNSRVYIINSVIKKDQSIVGRVLKDFYRTSSVLSVDNPSELERAQIFYNHLLCMSGITNEHYKNLQEDGRYLKILNHENYNPRLMWHVTQNFFLDSIMPNQFFDSIMKALESPDMIWSEEFNKRLSKTDRMILTSLCSITPEDCELDLCREVFFKRLRVEGILDSTCDYWQTGLNVLNGSMISLSIRDGKRFISVINPSVNDYLLRFILPEGSEERLKLRKTITTISQITRLFRVEESMIVLAEKLKDDSLLKLWYPSEMEKGKHIAALVSRDGVCHECYRPYMRDFLNGRYLRERCSLYSNTYSLFFIILLEHPETLAFYYEGDDPKRTVFTFLQGESLSSCLRAYVALKNNPSFLDLSAGDNYSDFIELIKRSIEIDFCYVANELISDYSLEELEQTEVSELSDIVNGHAQVDLISILNPETSILAANVSEDVLGLIEDYINGLCFDFSSDIEERRKDLISIKESATHTNHYSDMKKIRELFMKPRLK